MMDYTQLMLPHTSLGDLPPFEVLYGYTPKALWDWKDDLRPATDDLNLQEVYTYARRNCKALEYICKSIQKVQTRMAKSANRHRRSVDFAISDYI
jgi:hypothetical protein